jgi:mRNA interferase RelE/StbE
MFRITIKKSAIKELETVPKLFRLKIIEAIDNLAVNPRPSGVKKLEGSKNSYRVRVGHYRVVYEIIDRELIVEVIKVGDRKEVYRNR